MRPRCVNQGTDTVGECTNLERLRHYLHARVEAAITDGGSVGIPCDEQHFKLGPAYPSGIGHLAAVQSAR